MNKTNVYKTGMWLGFLSDVAAISAAFFLTCFAFSVSVAGALPIYISSLVILILFLTMLDAYDDLCSYTAQKSRLPITLAVAFVLSVLVLALLYMVFLKHIRFAYRFCMLYLFFAYVFMLAGRQAVLRLLIRIRKTQSLLILHAPNCPELFLKKLKRKAEDFGRVSFFELTSDEPESKALDAIDKTYQVLLLGNIPLDVRDKYIVHCLSADKTVSVIPTVENLSFIGGRIMHIGDTPVIGLKNSHLALWEKAIKRAFDFTAALIGLVIASPIFLICAAAIRLDSRGPVFYKQERYTIYKKRFDILKFRTMVQDAEKTGARLATENDDRITRVGKILRLCRLDELPQLVNILKGDMSFVGPRPERPIYADRYSEMVKNYDVRYVVKAGLTGYAQIYGQYNTKVSDKVLFDSIYIKNFSLWLDLKLIVQTAMIMFIKESTEGVEESMAAAPPQKGMKKHDSVHALR